MLQTHACLLPPLAHLVDISLVDDMPQELDRGMQLDHSVVFDPMDHGILQD